MSNAVNVNRWSKFVSTHVRLKKTPEVGDLATSKFSGVREEP